MKTVVIGMSGGVDSSVAALLLKRQGYNVIGLYMNNWEEKNALEHCPAEEDFNDVKIVCEKIGIPYYSINFAKDYLDKVFKEFLKEYKKGRTPNPDVLCNKEIKFGPFLEYAEKLGADYIATGHYAGVKEVNSKFYLLKAKDLNKDQSYFLNQLNQKQLSKVIFPLYNLSKPEVRKIAEEEGLVTATKKDSTGICFIGERKFKEFLQTYIPAKPGSIKAVKTGEELGRHDGLMYYTLGQRRGLAIGGKKDFAAERWFVSKKDLKSNVLWVDQGNSDSLYSDGLECDKFNFISGLPNEKEFECKAKFRYRQPDQAVLVTIKEKGIKVVFKEKQKAITPGQYVVLYNKDICLGGGVIEKIIKKVN